MDSITSSVLCHLFKYKGVAVDEFIPRHTMENIKDHTGHNIVVGIRRGGFGNNHEPNPNRFTFRPTVFLMCVVLAHCKQIHCGR